MIDSQSDWSAFHTHERLKAINVLFQYTLLCSSACAGFNNISFSSTLLFKYHMHVHGSVCCTVYPFVIEWVIGTYRILSNKNSYFEEIVNSYWFHSHWSWFYILSEEITHGRQVACKPGQSITSQVKRPNQFPLIPAKNHSSTHSPRGRFKLESK